MIEYYSKLELILFKKKILQQLKNELLSYKNGNPALVNSRPFPVGYSGTGKCQKCGNNTQYYSFLNTNEYSYILCDTCRKNATKLEDDIAILTNKPKRRRYI